MNSNIKVYNKIPNDFDAKVEVAAIYVKVDDKILLLQLANNKAEKGAWGLPAGKLEVLEMPLQAAQRELFEETGIYILSTDQFQSLGTLYMRKPQLDYAFHLFEIKFDIIPTLTLSNEHSSHKWVSKEEAENLPLMSGGKEALDNYYQHSSNLLK